MLLATAAKALGQLGESLVLVGGCATEFLITAERAENPRPTDDVDLVAQVVSIPAYHALEGELRKRGFTPDRSDGAPICRWIIDGVKVDILPSEEILGFRNRWFPLAVSTSVPLELPLGVRMRRIHGPAFLATKLEAFRDRGKGDFLESHDLEDLAAVVDGRIGLEQELRHSDSALKTYVGTELDELLSQDGFLTALPGYLPGDAASQARLPLLLERMRTLAKASRDA